MKIDEGGFYKNDKDLQKLHKNSINDIIINDRVNLIYRLILKKSHFVNKCKQS